MEREWNFANIKSRPNNRKFGYRSFKKTQPGTGRYYISNLHVGFSKKIAIGIVHFPKGADDPQFFEAPAITGPVPQQICQTLLYLKINTRLFNFKKKVTTIVNPLKAVFPSVAKKQIFLQF